MGGCSGDGCVSGFDPGGYDAYRVAPHFAPADKAKDGLPTTRFGVRKAGLSEEELARVQTGGWDLPLLQRVVDQFVIHYDVCGEERWGVRRRPGRPASP